MNGLNVFTLISKKKKKKLFPIHMKVYPQCGFFHQWKLAQCVNVSPL